jgi:type IV secretory pathway VirJ component
MLAQAPAETFAGGVSIDFCPELRLRKRLCETNSLHTVPIGKDRSHSLLVRDKLDAQWIVFQSSTQRACRPAVAQRFVSEAPGAEIQPVSLDPKSGNWEAALSVAVQRLDPPPKKRAAAPPAELAGLPIVEVPAKHAGSTFAILISGDGGWAGIDKAVAAALAEKGIAVVGVDSLRYFWKERTPQSAAADVDRIIQHYLNAWDKQDILLIGYSQGADILPFVVNRLPAATRDDVRLVAMLGLGVRAVFEFHLANWLSQSDDGLPIAPELQRMSSVRGLCIYSDEGDSSCPEAASSTLRAVSLPGGHHFGGDYDRVAALILEQLR